MSDSDGEASPMAKGVAVAAARRGTGRLPPPAPPPPAAPPSGTAANSAGLASVNNEPEILIPRSQGPRNPTYDVSRARTPTWSFTRRGQPNLGFSHGGAGRQGPGSYDPRGGSMGYGRSTSFGRGSARFGTPGYVPDQYLGPGHYGIVKTIAEVFSRRKKFPWDRATRAQAGAAHGQTEQLMGQASPGPKYMPASESMALFPDGPTIRFGNAAPRGYAMFREPTSGSIGPGDYQAPEKDRTGKGKPMAGLGFATRGQHAMATGVLETLVGSESPGPGRYDPRPNKDSRWKTSQKWSLNARETVEAYERHQLFWKGLEPSPADTIFTTFQGPKKVGKVVKIGLSRRF